MQDTKESEDVGQFVCFKLAEEEYALEIHCVREVIRVPRITPVPQMPDFCLGVINLRGNVIPLFDLRRKFGLQEKMFDDLTKILVASLSNVSIGFVADEVLENIKLDESQIDQTPPVKMKIEKECVRGIGELEGRMIIVLDMGKIHALIKKGIKSKWQLTGENAD